MAKVNGIVKIEGTIDDLTFYKSDGKTLVRKKGGVGRERIMNDPSFVRTRENGAEFGHSASSGKLLRTAVGTMVFKAKDKRLSSRLMKKMSEIKNFDSTSSRGGRLVGNGIGTPEGKMALTGFDFNENARLGSVLHVPYLLDTSNGRISFTDLIVAEQISYPQGATHISLQCAFLNLDFTTEVHEIAYSNIENLAIDMTVVSPILTPTAVPAGSGTQFYLLMISFYQQVNGVQYSLKNEEYNSLSIVGVV